MSDGKILLIGLTRNNGLELVRSLANLGVRPMAAAWPAFQPKSYRRDRPDAILANVDNPQTPDFSDFCRLVRKLWGERFPIIAVSAGQTVSHTASLLDAGASDCLPENPPPPLLERKVRRALAAPAAAVSELAEDVPGSLHRLFHDNPRLVRLGDLAAIYPGAAPRRPWSRRAAPPDDTWRGVATSGTLERFRVGKPDAYLLWSRFHLFRVPEKTEYDVPEKVLLSRAGPPLTAAIDKSRLPAGSDVYSLVPQEGVGAASLACLLNSRLMDFYCNRLAGSRDSRLRPEVLRAIPVPRPERLPHAAFARFAALLAHYGPEPQSWIDRQTRDEVWEEMEDTVFSLYGAGASEREELAALHF